MMAPFAFIRTCIKGRRIQCAGRAGEIYVLFLCCQWSGEQHWMSHFLFQFCLMISGLVRTGRMAYCVQYIKHRVIVPVSVGDINMVYSQQFVMFLSKAEAFGYATLCTRSVPCNLPAKSNLLAICSRPQTLMYRLYFGLTCVAQ